MGKLTEKASELRPQSESPLFGEYFDLNVRWRGGRRAIAFGDSVLTWNELGERAYQVANGLRKLGIGRGDAVVVLLENRLETAEIVLGVIRSGACVVPINLHISDEAIARQIKDCGATAVFATEGEATRVDCQTRTLTQSHRIIVGREIEGWSKYALWRSLQAPSAPRIENKPDDPFTIVYSSGTTGTPKGIVHTHLTRLRNMRGLGLALRIHEETVWVTSLGFYSNAAMLPVLMTLLVGGCVVILPKFDSSIFLNAIESHRGTHFMLVPVMLRMILADQKFDDRDVSSVELICVAGAEIEPEFKEQGCAKFGCVLLELYGLTEGFLSITSASDGAEKRASVGRPLPGTDLKILRDDGTQADVGESGEIVGLTDAVMSGYLNRPEENAEVFIQDERGRRWLRTGDLGWLDADGFLYYVGRKKDLIVSGGQNVYPVDIEEVGQQHPLIDQIAVVGVPHHKWGETPVAVIIPKEGASVQEAEAQEWINSRLGKRQRVSAVVIVDSFPINALGKVLKRKLRDDILADQTVVNLIEGKRLDQTNSPKP